MPNTRKSMRKIRHVLKLARESGLSTRAIARSLAMSPTSVGEYLRRAEAAGLEWPLPADYDDRQLEAALFPRLPKAVRDKRPLPEWAEVYRELQKRHGITLVLLWEEYKAIHPEGIQYSQFCERYRAWVGKRNLVMRQNHRGGEKLFVDYAGQSVAVINPQTGEVRDAQIFVATMGASHYTFAVSVQTTTLLIGERDIGFHGSVEKLRFPHARREINHVFGGVDAHPLQHVDQVSVDVNPV